MLKAKYELNYCAESGLFYFLSYFAVNAFLAHMNINCSCYANKVEPPDFNILYFFSFYMETVMTSFVSEIYMQSHILTVTHNLHVIRSKYLLPRVLKQQNLILNMPIFRTF